MLVGHRRQVLRGIGLELLEEDTLGGDPAERLTVGRARDGDRHRARGAVPGEPDDADVVAEVLAAELRADPELPGQLEHLELEVEVAEAVPGGRPRGRQRVEVVRARVLRRLQRVLRAGAADDDRQVVRRAGRRPERAELLVEEPQHRRGVQDGLRLLVQERLVGAAATLGHEQELVPRLVARLGVGVDLDLGGQVRAGVPLVPHGQRCELGVPQVQLRVGVEDAAADRLLVGDPLVRRAGGEDVRPALAHDDRGPGVLAHGQDAARGDVRVLEQVQRDEPVVGARLGVVEDAPQLREMGRPQEVRDVVHRRGGQQPQGLRRHLQEGPSAGLETLAPPRS